MFIDRHEKVAVTDDEGRNTIYIRPKMDVGTRGRVTDAMASLTGLGDDLDTAEVALNLGSHNAVLLVHNIMDWDGPAFMLPNGHKVPCVRENILRLDPDEPLVEAVLAEVQRRNLRPESPIKNSPTASGSTSAGEQPSPDEA